MSTPAPGNQQFDLGEAINKLSEGQKVFGARYTLMKIVGRSTLAVIWLAWDEKNNRDVALKFFPVTVAEDASAIANLKREVKKIQEEIKNPQIVSIYDVEVDGHVVALAMEYVEGITLAGLRDQKKNKCFAPQELADWLQQLCTILEQTNAESHMLHGDIKPSNLMVTQKGQLRILDYGLDTIISDFVSRTTEIKAAGRSLPYSSPQKAGGEPYTVSDEIYSIAATVYELLTSRPPFYTGDLMLQVQQKVPPPMVHRRKELRVIGEPVPRVWEETIAACLAKSPSQRPQTISQFVDGLELEAPPSAEMQESPVTQPPAQQQGNNTMLIVAGVVVLLVVAIAGLMLGKGKKKEEEAVRPVKAGPTAEQVALDAQATKELEAKRQAAKTAEAEAKRLMAESERLKQEQAKQAAAAEKAQQAAEAKQKAAEAEAKRLLAEAEKAKQMAASQLTEAAKKAAEEAEAKRMTAQKEAERLIAEAKKLKEDEAKRIAAAEAARKTAESKRMSAESEAKRLAELAEEQRVREMALAAERARKEAEAKKAAEEKARQEAARIEAERKAAAAALAARRLTPGKPWVNSLGVKLVPVGKTMVAIWECRVSDFEAFIGETKYPAGTGWQSPGFKQEESHPVVNVNWADAQAFCKWLTDKETKATLISGYRYRLPSDLEWSAAAMLSGESGGTPMDRNRKVMGVYPWGTAWPPPIGAGNYENRVSYDTYANTSPVASFLSNGYGIYDLGGNVWELCEDWADASKAGHVIRGASWQGYEPGLLDTSVRHSVAPNERKNDVGFRIVLVPAS